MSPRGPHRSAHGPASRPPRGDTGPLFFEALRTAETRLPAGLVRLGPPARDSDLLAAEARLGRKLPEPLQDLLRSFDGADLFHETVVIFGVGSGALRSLVEGNAGPLPPKLHTEELIIGGTSTDELFALEPDDEGSREESRVFRLHADADERWLVGSSLGGFLESTLAHNQLLYGPDGEFLLDAFEEGGEELSATYALRRAERALKKDPQAAVYHHEAGLALRRMGRHQDARAAFGRAAALDPANPWPWFDLGRSERLLGQVGEAAAAFECAGEASLGGARGRFFVWSARCFYEAGERDTAARLLDEARRGHPTLAQELRRAADAAATGHGDGDTDDDGDPGDPEAESPRDAEELAVMVETGKPPMRRLPVVTSAAAPAAQALPAKTTPVRTTPATAGARRAEAHTLAGKKPGRPARPAKPKGKRPGKSPRPPRR
jgi:tetratricopeptide (TPR) repeat protein